MPEMKSYPPGTFSWAELVTSDAASAKAFYAGVLGWSYNDQPVGPDAVYTKVQIHGKDVAALYQMNDQQAGRGVRPHWNSYVTVASADETTATVKKHGGTAIGEPFDVFDAGRMAMLTDPEGAGFCIWQPKQHRGASLVNEPGALCWNELLTRDPAKAEAFYTQVFGWGVEKMDMGEMTYTVFKNGERPNGGMLPISSDWGDVPASWMIYFSVEALDAALEQAVKLGGKPVMEPREAEGVGRFVTLLDPQGAALSLIQMPSQDG